MHKAVTEMTAGLVKNLNEKLRRNLASLILYGSGTGAGFDEKRSDINILIVLNQSTPEAHQTIFNILADYPSVSPFILGRRGIDRSMIAFAPKFLSIRRNYRVLLGEDILAEFKVAPEHEKFLVEQTLRNLRLRAVFHFEKSRTEGLRYRNFLRGLLAPISIAVTEVIRLSGKEADFSDDLFNSIPELERFFEADFSILRELELDKRKNDKLDSARVFEWHRQIYQVLDQIIFWMEKNWRGSDCSFVHFLPNGLASLLLGYGTSLPAKELCLPSTPSRAKSLLPYSASRTCDICC